MNVAFQALPSEKSLVFVAAQVDGKDFTLTNDLAVFERKKEKAGILLGPGFWGFRSGLFYLLKVFLCFFPRCSRVSRTYRSDFFLLGSL